MIIENNPISGQTGLARQVQQVKAVDSEKLASGVSAAIPEEEAANLSLSGDVMAKQSEHVSRRLDVAAENQKASTAEITDFEAAREMFNKIRDSILAEPGQAARAQANQQAENVLKLL